MAGRWETVDIKQESSCPAPPASHLPPSRGMLYCPNYSLRCHSHCNIYIYKWYQTTTFSNIYLLLQGCKLRYCNNKIAKYVFNTDVWSYVNKFKREEMKDFEQSCMKRILLLDFKISHALPCNFLLFFGQQCLLECVLLAVFDWIISCWLISLRS